MSDTSLNRWRGRRANQILRQEASESNPILISQPVHRSIYVRQAIRLEYVTIGYNIFEGTVSLVLGKAAGSIALISFGLDSFIESFSGLVVLWRFRRELHHGQSSAVEESRALRCVGLSFFLLSAYVVAEAVRKLWLQEAPESSLAGIALALLSLAVMPWLSRRKHETAKSLQSSALAGDSKQTLACSLLSLTLLFGLSLNALFAWWWVDPLAGLIMVPWLVQEGREALQEASSEAGSSEE